MLLGKMLRGLTGTPMRRMALANSSLAEAEPEPLTLANLMTKSLMAWMASCGLPPGCAFVAARRHRRRPARGGVQQELLHVPGAGRAALGAQAAVQADVLVLDHHAPVFEPPATYRSWSRFGAGAFRRRAGRPRRRWR